VLIIGINGSPRGSKSQTLRLLQAALNGAKEGGATVELIDLGKLRIEPCRGCQTCYREGSCILKDEMLPVYEKILSCDGLILGSPNYFETVTAQMKALIDRMSDAVHCQLLTRKYGASVSSAGSPAAAGDVGEYLGPLFNKFGAQYAGGVGASPSMGPEAFEEAEKKAFALGKELAAAISSKRIYEEQQKEIKDHREYFKRLVMRFKDEWRHEADHWSKVSG
jgi:multimeric flavodoxin WrbA